jgi:hypothetical protein
MKYVLIVAAVTAIATPALAEEIGVGVGVGPVGGGVTVGDSHRDYDRDRDRDRTTVIKEREPADHTTVIKKENEDGTPDQNNYQRPGVRKKVRITWAFH